VANWGDDPLETVRRPDAHPVALADVEGQQCAGGLIDLRPQFGVAGPVLLMANHQRVAVAEQIGGAPQQVADSVAQQRDVDVPVSVGQGCAWL